MCCPIWDVAQLFYKLHRTFWTLSSAWQSNEWMRADACIAYSRCGRSNALYRGRKILGVRVAKDRLSLALNPVFRRSPRSQASWPHIGAQLCVSIVPNWQSNIVLVFPLLLVYSCGGLTWWDANTDGVARWQKMHQTPDKFINWYSPRHRPRANWPSQTTVQICQNHSFGQLRWVPSIGWWNSLQCAFVKELRDPVEGIERQPKNIVQINLNRTLLLRGGFSTIYLDVLAVLARLSSLW